MTDNEICADTGYLLASSTTKNNELAQILQIVKQCRHEQDDSTKIPNANHVAYCTQLASLGFLGSDSVQTRRSRMCQGWVNVTTSDAKGIILQSPFMEAAMRGGKDIWVYSLTLNPLTGELSAFCTDETSGYVMVVPIGDIISSFPRGKIRFEVALVDNARFVLCTTCKVNNQNPKSNKKKNKKSTPVVPGPRQDFPGSSQLPLGNRSYLHHYNSVYTPNRGARSQPEVAPRKGNPNTPSGIGATDLGAFPPVATGGMQVADEDLPFSDGFSKNYITHDSTEHVSNKHTLPRSLYVYPITTRIPGGTLSSSGPRRGPMSDGFLGAKGDQGNACAAPVGEGSREDQGSCPQRGLRGLGFSSGNPKGSSGSQPSVATPVGLPKGESSQVDVWQEGGITQTERCMRLATNVGSNIFTPEDPEVVEQMLKNNNDVWQYFYDGERGCFYRDSPLLSNNMLFGKTVVQCFVAF